MGGRHFRENLPCVQPLQQRDHSRGMESRADCAASNKQRNSNDRGLHIYASLYLHHALQVPDMAAEDVHRAVREAHTSQRSWAALTAKVHHFNSCPPNPPFNPHSPKYPSTLQTLFSGSFPSLMLGISLGTRLLCRSEQLCVCCRRELGSCGAGMRL